MQNRPDYYRVLHVHPDAPTEVIKASHRTLMQRLRMHPDLGGEHGQAVLLNQALATLCDPARRAAYDATRDHQAADQPGRVPDVSPAHRATRPSACAFCSAPAAAPHVHQRDDECHACGSALFPARQHRVDEQSRRAAARLPRSLPLTFRRAESSRQVLRGTTDDVSLNGARFSSDSHLRVGERVSLECQFCSAVAVVRSVRVFTVQGRERCEVGVEFLTLRIKHARGGLVSTVA
jgi:curved DNA-binding protein CbpA